jgi:hypothetical protein
MPSTEQTSPHPLLDTLHQSLHHALTFLTQKWENVPLVLNPKESLSKNSTRRSFLLEGPEGLSVEVSLAVFLLGDDTYEIYVELENGPTRRFPCAPEEGSAPSRAPSHLERSVTSFLLREVDPRLGQVSGSPPSEKSSHTPRLRLDRDALIQSGNAAARRALDHDLEGDPQPHFFSYVHGRNLRRVMQDLAHMANHGLQRARWLLRLRAGTDRWRWYRAAARNRLSSEGHILVSLPPFGHARRDP